MASSIGGDPFANIGSRASNPEQQRVVAILGAIRETIAAQLSGDGPVPPAAYFAALMTALERSGSTHAKEILYLLARVLPTVSPSVVRSKLGPISSVLFASLGASALAKDAAVVRSLVACLGAVCAALEPDTETWARPEVSRLLAALLAFASDTRPKVRHAAQSAVLDIAQTHYTSRTYACSGGVTHSLVAALQTTSQRDSTRALQCVPLLRSALPLLPLSALAPLCDAVLRLPRAGIPRLTTAAYDVLATLMESPRARLSVKFAGQVVTALVRAPPSPDDPASAAEFSYALAASVTRLGTMERVRAGLPPEIAMTFPRLPHPAVAAGAPSATSASDSVAAALGPSLLPAIDALLPLFSSDRAVVHHAAANAIAIMLTAIVDAGAVSHALAAARSPSSSAATVAASEGGVTGAAGAPLLARIVQKLDGLLAYQFQASWPVSLPLLALLYRLLGHASSPLMNGVTTALAAVRMGVEEAIAEGSAKNNGDDEDEEGDDWRRGGAGEGRRGGAGSDDDSDDDSDDGGGRGRRNNNAAPTARRQRTAHASATLDTITAVMAVAVRAYGGDGIIGVLGLAVPPSQPQSSASFAGAPATSTSVGTIAPGREWLLHLLRDNLAFSRTPLAFFPGGILPIIKAEEAASRRAVSAGLPKTARFHRARVLQLWALLPPLLSAPTDLLLAFNVPMGKLLTSAMSDSNWPELPTIVARALETAILRTRAAAGLPPLTPAGLHAAPDANGYFNIGEGGEEGGLTVVGGGGGSHRASSRKQSSSGAGAASSSRGAKGKRRGGAGDASDEDAHDDDDDDDDESSVGSGGGGADAAAAALDDDADGDDGDGATTIFGAGGVSVYGGPDGAEANASSDPRHPLLISAIELKGGARSLPGIPRSTATAQLEALRGYAKNYVPVLFNVYEGAVLSGPSSTALTSSSSGGGASSSSASVNERSRKVLDAIAAYVSIAPPDLTATLGERLLKLLTGGMGAMASADSAVGRAREEHRAADAAASKGALGRPTVETGAALAVSVKAAAAAAVRMCSLLSLALALVPSLHVPPPPPQPPKASASSAVKRAAAAAAATAAAEASAPEPLLARFFAVVRPAVADDTHPAVQKRAYGVLACLLGSSPAHTSFSLDDPVRRDDLLTFLVGSLAAASAAARRGRLVCLQWLVRGLDVTSPHHVSLLPGMLGEVMLAVKDANARVRGSALAVLHEMGALMASGGDGGGAAEWDEDLAAAADEAMDDDDESEDEGEGEGGGGESDDASVVEDEGKALRRPRFGSGKGLKKQQQQKKQPSPPSASSSAPPPPPTPATVTRVTLTEFYRMLLGGLGGASPHMRSAAVLCLSRTLYDFAASPASQSLLRPLLNTVLLLLREQSREVVKSVVGFVKVAASCMPPETLAGEVPTIVPALLQWSGESKNRIRAKIKGVLSRLMRKVGFDAVAAHVPASDAPLVAAMRKKRAKIDRKRAAAAAAAGGAGGVALSARSLAGGGGGGDADDDEDDDGEEGDLFEGGGSEDDEDEDARSRMSAADAASVARSWSVVGSRAPRGGPQSVSLGLRRSSGGGGASASAASVAPSRMTAVTMSMRASSALLSSAPLPPAGAILGGEGDFVDKKQQVAMRSGGGSSKALGGSVAPSAAAASSRHRRGAASTSASNLGHGHKQQQQRGSAALVPSAQLRTDDESPMDLLDPHTLRQSANGGIGGNSSSSGVLAARARAARVDASAAAGTEGVTPASYFKLDKGGRLIIPDDAEEVAAALVRRPGMGAQGSNKRRRLAASDGDDDDDGDDAGAGADNADIRARASLQRRGAAAPASSSSSRGGDDDDDGDEDMDEGGDGGDEDNGDDDGAFGQRKQKAQPRKHARRGDDAPSRPSSSAGQQQQGWGMMKPKHGGRGGSSVAPGASSASSRYSGAQYRGGASSSSSAGGDRSESGGGDVKRKGAKFEPFAYVPLDAKSMSGKHGAKAVGRFAGVTASTTKGMKAVHSNSRSGSSGGRAGGKRKR